MCCEWNSWLCICRRALVMHLCAYAHIVCIHAYISIYMQITGRFTLLKYGNICILWCTWNYWWLSCHHFLLWVELNTYRLIKKLKWWIANSFVFLRSRASEVCKRLSSRAPVVSRCASPCKGGEQLPAPAVGRLFTACANITSGCLS